MCSCRSPRQRSRFVAGVTVNSVQMMMVQKTREETQKQEDDVDEIARFDNSKRGVKGMVESGIQRVPNFFVQPRHKRPQLDAPCISQDNIPLVDLEGIESHSRAEIVQQIARACQTWGFFQVLNHSVPVTLMERMMEAARAFDEGPSDQKTEYYTHDFNALIKYAPSFNLREQESADWKDALRVMYAPSAPHPTRWPAALREVGLEYCQHVRILARTVLNLLSEALSLPSNYLVHTINCMRRQYVMLNFYPPCPEPDLTLGSTIHSDSGSITILMMDQVGGLQVKHNGTWHAVSPVPGTFVINIADQLEILSNGRFKSVEHCAVTNSVKARVSIPTFFSPLMKSGVKIGPIPALLNASNPPVYGSVDFDDYMTSYMNTADHSKSCLDLVRLGIKPN